MGTVARTVLPGVRCAEAYIRRQTFMQFSMRRWRKRHGGRDE